MSWRRSLSFLPVLSLLFASVPAPARAISEEDFAWGVVVDTTDARSMRMARQGGFTHAKMMLQWANVEPSPGRYLWEETTANDFDNIMNAAREEEMLLVVRVDGVPGWAGGSPAKADLGAVRRFYENAARYAAGTVVAYEILNEPNLDREWGGAPDPVAYTAFLKAAYKGIKAGDSDALVLGGGPAPGTGNNPGATIEDVDFINGMYDAGAKNVMDALSVHSYGGNTEPELDPSSCGICFRRTEKYRDVMVRRGDRDKPVWLTEWGYMLDPGQDFGQYDWMKLPAKKQAEYIVRAHQYALKNWPWLEGSLLYNIDGAASPYQNYGIHDAKAWFSLLDADYSPRPAFKAFKEYREPMIARIERAKAEAAARAEAEARAAAAQAPGAAPPEPASTDDTVAAAPEGERLRVTGTGGSGLNLRAAPALTAARIKTLPEGAIVIGLGEPRQADGRLWLNVRDSGGTNGWVAAEYVQRV